MVRKRIALTLIVGTAIGLLIWDHLPAAWTSLHAIGLILAGAGFVLWTIARFQLGNSFAVTPQARQLVTHGLYSKIRNPIYFFGSFVIVGLILALASPIWLLIFALIIPMQLWRAHKEAQVLEEKFGEEYRSYRAGTWF